MRFLFALLLIPELACSGPTNSLITLHNAQREYVVGLQTMVLIDPNKTLTINDIRKVEDGYFQPVDKAYPMFTDTQPTYWLRFRLQQQSANLRYLLEVAFGNIRRIDLYIVDSQGRMTQQKVGDDLARASRLIDFPTYLLPLPLRAGEPYTVYLRLNNQGPHAYFPLIIREELACLNYIQSNTLLWGFYWGILVLVFLYHIVFWGFTRNRGYLYLGLYLLAYIGFELSRGSNFGMRYIWPNSVWFALNGLGFFSTLVLFSFTLFYSRILSLKRSVPVLFYTLCGLCAVGALLLVNSVLKLIPVQSTQLMAILSSYPLVLIMFLAGLITWRQGQQASRYYIIASMCYALGFTVFVLNRSGVLPGMGLLVHYSQNAGSLFEILFMSVGLADYVRTQRQQRLDEERRHATTEQRRLAGQSGRKKKSTTRSPKGKFRNADGWLTNCTTNWAVCCLAFGRT